MRNVTLSTMIILEGEDRDNKKHAIFEEIMPDYFPNGEKTIVPTFRILKQHK